MGKLFERYLEGDDVYECKGCGIHLTTSKELISTSFRGRTGPAWLFTKVVNISEGPFEECMLTTGQHTIVDIYCNNCGSNLGWKYEEAIEDSQKYKKGKYILEKALLKINNPNQNYGEEDTSDD